MPDDRNIRSQDGLPPPAAKLRMLLQVALNSTRMPERMNDYELLDEIARGGMGVVYRARQIKLNRMVAVKMILRGEQADEATVQRFRTEATAAAHLQHPNIVTIHEVGEHEGRHYFSMDLVEGRSLAQIVRDNPLPAERAAGYVKAIAEAVHYAHKRGVVHRDLKPGNVLVDRVTDQPRVTDFGLARWLKDDSGQTRTGAVMGTPSYMSPEQAAGQTKAAETRSDIYSLGALLYELLVRRPPFHAATPVETMRQVLDNEPVSPRLLNANVPRDLETICLKCLEKEPARRYDSAQELADDLGRWLRTEPIRARPSGLWTRARKWTQRKPGTAVLITALAAVVFAGVGGVLWQWRKAEEILAWLRLGVSEFVGLMEEDPLARRVDPFALPESALNRTASLLKTVAQQGSKDPELARQSGLVLKGLARLQVEMNVLPEAVTNARQAQSIFLSLAKAQPGSSRLLGDLAESCVRLAVPLEKMGQVIEAEDLYRQAIATNQFLVRTHPREPAHRLRLARANLGLSGLLSFVGRLEDSAKTVRGALAEVKALVATHPEHHLFKRELDEVSLELGITLAADESGLAQSTNVLWQVVGRLRELSRTNAPTPEEKALLARAWHNLGDSQYRLTQYDEAERSFREAIGFWGQLAADFPRMAGFLRNQARACEGLYKLQVNTSRWSDAAKSYTTATNLLENLQRGFALDLDSREALAELYSSMGIDSQQAGRPEGAALFLRQARVLYASLTNQVPLIPAYRAGLIRTVSSQAGLFHEMGRRTEAEALYREAILAAGQLRDAYPEVPSYTEAFALHQLGLTTVLFTDTNRLVECGPLLSNALNLVRTTLDRPAVRRQSRGLLAKTYYLLGKWCIDQNQLRDAEEHLRASLPIRQSLTNDFPRPPYYRADLAETYGKLGDVLQLTRRLPQAIEAWRQSVMIQESLLAEFPHLVGVQRRLAEDHHILCKALVFTVAPPKQPYVIENIPAALAALDVAHAFYQKFPEKTEYKAWVEKVRPVLVKLANQAKSEPEKK